MDLLKSKIYLDKLNREYLRMSKDPDNIARIDVDIMASYVRELYDAILSDTVPAAGVLKKSVAAQPPRPVVAEVPVPPTVVPHVSPVEPVPPAPAPAPPPPVAAPVAPPPVVPPPPPPAPEPVVVAPVAPEPLSPVVPETVRVEPAATHTKRQHHHAEGDYDNLFEEKQAKELSEKLSEMPIADLRRAIALNDRLLLTRELFAGDGQAFETALNTLNTVGNFSEAKAYLVEHCVVRYGWSDKKRLETAKDFIKLVRRRYK